MHRPQEARRERGARLRVGHFEPLDVVTVECSDGHQPDVVLLAANDHQQLLFGDVFDLVDAFALAHACDFCTTSNIESKK